MITDGFFHRTGGPGDHGHCPNAAGPLMLEAPEPSATGAHPAMPEDGDCLDDWFGMSAACEDHDGCDSPDGCCR